MPSGFYASAKEALLRGQIDFASADIRAALVTTGYIPDLLTHSNLTHVAPSAQYGSVVLAGKSVANGVFDADDITINSVPTGSTYNGVILFINGSSAANSRLIAYIDNIIGFPVAGTGGDFIIRWSDGPAKIFSL